MRVGVAVDGRHHCSFFTCGAERLDRLDNPAPVGMAEWRIDCHDVVRRYALCVEKGLQYPIGRARIDVVRAKQNPSANVAAFLAPQVSDRRDRLLIGSGSGVEDIAGAFLTFVLHRVVEEAIQFLEDRQDGLTRGRCPAAEYNCDLFFCEQFPGFLGEEVPVGIGIDYDGLQFAPKQATLSILILYQHEDRVLEHRFADSHRSGKGMQNAHPDWSIFGICSWRSKAQQHHKQPPFGTATSPERRRFHGNASASSYTRVSVVIPLATTESIDLNAKLCCARE